MQIVDADAAYFQHVPPGSTPEYDSNNPIRQVIALIESIRYSATREHYLADSLQYIIPFDECGLYSPTGDGATTQDPRLQDNKNDFQKQNVASFKASPILVSRGYARAGDWCGSFIKFAYLSSPFTELAQASGGSPGASLKLWVKIGDSAASGLITVPYDAQSGRYQVELWSYGGSAQDLSAQLSQQAKEALSGGFIQLRPDLVTGSFDAFVGPGFDEDRTSAVRNGSALEMYDRFPDHSMHPVRPLRIEMAWANEDASAWDSRQGQNHIHEFSMLLRGWNNYFQVGQSKNPHGGVGFLEFRNLFSNYFSFEGRRRQVEGDAWEPELGRTLGPWNFNAYTWRPGEANPVGEKNNGASRESFMAVDYMDLHILQPSCGIGIHRHRDNQEVFFLLEGKGLMIVGDWCQMPRRERAFEARTMLPGDLSVCKTGQLHALFNLLDEPTSLFMFGGYD